jgi:hypothetical protein
MIVDDNGMVEARPSDASISIVLRRVIEQCAPDPF